MTRSSVTLACLLLAGCGLPTPNGTPRAAQFVIGTVASDVATRSTESTRASLIETEPASATASETASTTSSPAGSTSAATPSFEPAATATAPAAPTPESGTWDFTWTYGGRPLDVTLQMTFSPDGTIAFEPQADPQATWGAGTAKFVGGCGFHAGAPSIFGSCEHYTMQVIAPDRMQGQVTFLVNLKPLVLPVEGVLEVPKAFDCTTRN